MERRSVRSSCQQYFYQQKIIYTLTGPLASLFIALISCYIAFTFRLKDFLSFLFLIFLLLSIFDFLKNIIPSNQSITLHDGKIGHNDGTSLVRLFRHKSIPNNILMLLIYTITSNILKPLLFLTPYFPMD